MLHPAFAFPDLTPRDSSRASQSGESEDLMHGDLQQRIRERAYELWERSGRPDGRADEYWWQAERELGSIEIRVTGEAPDAPALAAAAEIVTAPIKAKAPRRRPATPRKPKG
jgi:Protein of unknown function (DUF2934)